MGTFCAVIALRSWTEGVPFAFRTVTHALGPTSQTDKSCRVHDFEDCQCTIFALFEQIHTKKLLQQNSKQVFKRNRGTEFIKFLMREEAACEAKKNCEGRAQEVKSEGSDSNLDLHTFQIALGAVTVLYVIVL